MTPKTCGFPSAWYGADTSAEVSIAIPVSAGPWKSPAVGTQLPRLAAEVKDFGKDYT